MTDMTPQEIAELLNDARIGRLSMADPEGHPYTIPLPFCWTGDTLYVRLPLTGRKGRIIAANDRVCFEADCCTDSFEQYASVLIEGRLVAVDDPAEKLRAKRWNDEKYRRLRHGRRAGHGRTTPIEDLPLKKIAAVRVTGRKKQSQSAATSNAPTPAPRAERSQPIPL
jgi:nitroimidazol reductase NimA-like FMN-containing flavoprotein (pyridoxamine 5'-phosphate oxidase superfamily)